MGNGHDDEMLCNLLIQAKEKSEFPNMSACGKLSARVLLLCLSRFCVLESENLLLDFSCSHSDTWNLEM